MFNQAIIINFKAQNLTLEQQNQSYNTLDDKLYALENKPLKPYANATKSELNLINHLKHFASF